MNRCPDAGDDLEPIVDPTSCNLALLFGHSGLPPRFFLAGPLLASPAFRR